jgi:hypothetical protein
MRNDLDYWDRRARAHGFKIKENVYVNKGFYCCPIDGRDNAPRTFPTPREAWENNPWRKARSRLPAVHRTSA